MIRVEDDLQEIIFNVNESVRVFENEYGRLSTCGSVNAEKLNLLLTCLREELAIYRTLHELISGINMEIHLVRIKDIALLSTADGYSIEIRDNKIISIFEQLLEKGYLGCLLKYPDYLEILAMPFKEEVSEVVFDYVAKVGESN